MLKGAQSGPPKLRPRVRIYPIKISIDVQPHCNLPVVAEEHQKLHLELVGVQ